MFNRKEYTMTLTENLQQILDSYLARGGMAGANILVLKDGREVCYIEGGYRNMEQKLPITRDTIFRLYSMTKPITSAAVMLLISRGRLDLTADISWYLPEFAELYVNTDGNRRPASKRITVRDLLNMTSGLAYPDNTYGGQQAGSVFWQIDQRLYSDSPVTTREFAGMMGKVDLCFEPGQEFMYGTSADILGAIVEVVSGMTFGEFLEKEFFVPLGMKDTGFYVPADKSCRLARVYNYTRDENWNEIQPVDYSPNRLHEEPTNHLGLRYMRDVPPAFESGGAGLCATIDDYAAFATMLLQNGTYKGRQVMPAMAIHHMTHNVLTEEQALPLTTGWGYMSGYSYGNLLRVCRDETQVSFFAGEGEYGWDGWLGTYFSNEPKYGITLLMGVQQIGTGDAGGMIHQMKNVVMSYLV